MMFTIATNSDALHEESGHGPITARTKEGLKDAMDAARRSGLSFTVRGEFELDSLPFTPMAIRTHNPAALLVRQEGVAAIGAVSRPSSVVTSPVAASYQTRNAPPPRPELAARTS